MAHIGYFVICALFLAFCYPSLADNFLPDDEDPLPPLHERRPRFVRMYSKGPDPDAEYQKGIGFTNHLKNLWKGGSVGFEFRTPRFDEYLEKFKEKFPFFSAHEFQRKKDAVEKDNEWTNVEEKENKWANVKEKDNKWADAEEKDNKWANAEEKYNKWTDAEEKDNEGAEAEEKVNEWADAEEKDNKWADAEEKDNKWADAEEKGNEWADAEEKDNEWTDAEEEITEGFDVSLIGPRSKP